MLTAALARELFKAAPLFGTSTQPMRARPGAIALLTRAAELGIPVLVVSAGFTSVIEGFLEARAVSGVGLGSHPSPSSDPDLDPDPGPDLNPSSGRDQAHGVSTGRLVQVRRAPRAPARAVCHPVTLAPPCPHPTPSLPPPYY